MALYVSCNVDHIFGRIRQPDLFSGHHPHGLFTYMFVHAGIGHLVGNLLLLWVLGDNTECELGPLAYIGLCAGSSIMGGIAQLLFWCIMGSAGNVPFARYQTCRRGSAFVGLSGFVGLTGRSSIPVGASAEDLSRLGNCATTARAS